MIKQKILKHIKMLENDEIWRIDNKKALSYLLVGKKPNQSKNWFFLLFIYFLGFYGL